MTTLEPLESEGQNRTRPIRAHRTVPNLATYGGLALTVAGCVLIVVAWGRVASLTSVALQIPYLISAGCAGLALIAGGLAVLSIAAKVSDSRARMAQMAELRETLQAIREALEESR